MGRFECLECMVEGRRLLVPMDGLERVAEFSLTAPPPWAEPWVAGLGLSDDRRPLVVVALQGGRRSSAVPEAAKAVLLRTSATSETFAVLVDDVRAIWSINPDAFVPAGDVGWPTPPAWLTAAVDGEERVLRLDTRAIERDLFGPASSASAEATA